MKARTKNALTTVCFLLMAAIMAHAAAQGKPVQKAPEFTTDYTGACESAFTTPNFFVQATVVSVHETGNPITVGAVPTYDVVNCYAFTETEEDARELADKYSHNGVVLVYLYGQLVEPTPSPSETSATPAKPRAPGGSVPSLNFLQYEWYGPTHVNRVLYGQVGVPPVRSLQARALRYLESR